MDFRTVLLQINDIERFMCILWIQKNHEPIKVASWPPNTTSNIRGLRCTNTHTSYTVPSLHAKACTYSANRSFVYNIYSIQKLKSQKNPRSMQTSTLWPSLTKTNDMLHSQQQSTPTMDFRTALLQMNDIWRFILILWIQGKSQRDQNDLGATEHEVQRAIVCTNTQKLHSTVLKQKRLDAFHE